jgi:hypothetical protein
VERERQREPWQQTAGAVEAVAVPDVLEQALVSARASGAGQSRRQALLEQLGHLDLGAPRATADRLLSLLASGQLEGLTGRGGTSARAVAVERLLQLGYPYALEVAPEDLAHWRAERPADASDGRGLGALLMTVAVALALWGFAEPPRNIGLLVVLGLEGLALTSALRPASRSWVRRLLFGLGVFACILGLFFGPATLVPGVAALVVARLLRR